MVSKSERSRLSRHDGPKTQTGIETTLSSSSTSSSVGHDGPKTQTGIETFHVDANTNIDMVSRRTENPDRD